MAEVAEDVTPCSNPGCDQPGTKSCSACKTTVYCGVICQTADWAHHKEECSGHLLKVGKTNLAKANGFEREKNWVQTLRYAELAATKLKKLKDRRLETVGAIDNALTNKFNALLFLNRQKEALECAKERYTLWAMNHMRHPGSMRAALALIQSCLHNKEFEDAENYARHAYFMIAEMKDNFIPADKRREFLADGSYWLDTTILALEVAGGIPPEEQQKTGLEVIALARKALALHTQLFGTESINVASDMSVLADSLDYFNDVDDDEVLRLREQAIGIHRRMEGSSSVNLAMNERKLGYAYKHRAKRAEAVKDSDRCVANVELSLPHFREAARIYTAANHVDNLDDILRQIALGEEIVRLEGIAKAIASTTG